MSDAAGRVRWPKIRPGVQKAASALVGRDGAGAEAAWTSLPMHVASQGFVTAALLRRVATTAGNAAVQRLMQALPGQEAAGQPNVGEGIAAAKGGGRALETSLQRTLEAGLGASLSGVRVHTDSRADALSRRVNAVAFTSGSDIFFRAGAFQPNVPEGFHVLAHEAAHTVQQRAGPVAGTPSTEGVAVSDPGDAFERAAEAQADKISRASGL